MLGKDRQMQIDKTNAQPCSEPAQVQLPTDPGLVGALCSLLTHELRDGLRTL